jgi:hypothetical protein
MINYLTEWLHLYSIHLGVITTLLILLDMYLKGLPETKEILSKFKSAIIIAACVAVFSSHAHNHMLFHLIKELK